MAHLHARGLHGHLLGGLGLCGGARGLRGAPGSRALGGLGLRQRARRGRFAHRLGLLRGLGLGALALRLRVAGRWSCLCTAMPPGAYWAGRGMKQGSQSAFVKESPNIRV